MSLFRKPKKIQRRVFSSNVDEDGDGTSLDPDAEMEAPSPPIITGKRDKEKSRKPIKTQDDTKPKALLSFADDEDDGEVFQVRKSSHSKKVMRMMDKERRKKKREERAENSGQAGGENGSTQHLESSSGYANPHSDVGIGRSKGASDQSKSKKSDNHMIQTEIRTDDFVLVVKKSETPEGILNGRAALCAGRDDMSDEDNQSEDGGQDKSHHRFSKPEHLKQMLESGSIPDAAMIHAARKRRQRAREQGAGDFIPIEEPKEQPKISTRLPCEDVEGDQSDDEERMDMNDITGRKEREERREQFYAVENDCMRTPQEIFEAIKSRLAELKERSADHSASIARISSELKSLKLQQLECQQNAPAAAAKYKFYQEVKCYVNDLVDCLAEKTPLINDLEKRALQQYGKNQRYLVNRRRQDVRDQAKEIAEASKPISAAARRTPEYEEQVRRAAEREGRRTRRRCERERNDLLASHLDGMSSDDEIPDQQQEQSVAASSQIESQSLEAFEDVTDDFCKVELILMKFYAWRKTDMSSYQDAFVSLCLPKVLAPIVRHEMLLWSPMLDEYADIENMRWYQACMLYACQPEETMEQLKNDPDVNLVPALIEKIVLPKLTVLVTESWDPLSTTQTLRLVGFINRLGREFPLSGTNKQLNKLFESIMERMRLALENDVFIPIFPKQVQEAKTSFFQRQFCSGLKLFRNFLSWQGILADKHLRELAISALLNRYLLLAMRVCTPNDAINKAYIIVNTLPTVWLLPNSDTLKNLELFINYIKQTLEGCDATNPVFIQSSDKAKQILQRLHSL
ncbi:uncharacterized protein Dana_GF17646 [Drosophila ananassae]|uniref:GCF C-terminal domain-containing protein n=1 Tax=Drosophila ananassae TaxID=7217 RepID=B3LYB9_DROAN|nr:uncharacterized protein Dana_GF17646 [Drosophila ananassae]